jgi:hypothetical protein
MLVEYLDSQRETVLSKTSGLTQAQLWQSHPPSNLTLGALLYHLSLVEEDWMEFRFAGLPEREPWASVDWEVDPNWEFRTSTSMDPAELQARYREAGERSRQVVSGGNSLYQMSAMPCEMVRICRCGGCCCTSSKRRLVTHATPIYCANRSTGSLVSS